LPFSDKKIIPQKTAEFRLFCGTENARKSVPRHSAEDKKTPNSIPNHVEEKNTQNCVISYRTIPQNIKMPGILFRTLTQKRKKTWNKAKE
jgi:hypothetical protein